MTSPAMREIVDGVVGGGRGVVRQAVQRRVGGLDDADELPVQGDQRPRRAFERVVAPETNTPEPPTITPARSRELMTRATTGRAWTIIAATASFTWSGINLRTRRSWVGGDGRQDVPAPKRPSGTAAASSRAHRAPAARAPSYGRRRTVVSAATPRGARRESRHDDEQAGAAIGLGCVLFGAIACDAAPADADGAGVDGFARAAAVSSQTARPQRPAPPLDLDTFDMDPYAVPRASPQVRLAPRPGSWTPVAADTGPAVLISAGQSVIAGTRARPRTAAVRRAARRRTDRA